MTPAEKTVPAKSEPTIGTPAAAAADTKAKALAKPAGTAKAPKAVKPAKAADKAPVAAKPAKEAKEKKPKLVRDSFTIPKNEYVVIEALKERAARLARPAKKSELLRAGIKALAALDDAALLAALGNVPAIKTGRPKQA